MRGLLLIVIIAVLATFTTGALENEKRQYNQWRPGKKALENEKRQVTQYNQWRPGKKDETHLLGNQLHDLQARQKVQSKNMWRPGKRDETHLLGNQLHDLQARQKVQSKNMWRPGKRDETHLLGNQLHDLQARQKVQSKNMWRPGKRDKIQTLGYHNAQASSGSIPTLNDQKQNDLETQMTGLGGVSPPVANIPFPRPGRKRLNYGHEKACKNIVNDKYHTNEDRK
ncbi:unnamed protein product [Pocillopora meandrina]|uniref:Uncharacterized protein n=1 Tax=Pocillopora meandrina TaxID=46732 RepID=A0AAU9VNU6_9CNID|nr:unnamed protein product [Pocillopora meandrina]